MILTARQIRAGRALVGWSARELAKRAVLSLNTVQRLELKEDQIRKASVATVQKVERALSDVGVVFLDDGRGVTLAEPPEGEAEEGPGIV